MIRVFNLPTWRSSNKPLPAPWRAAHGDTVDPAVLPDRGAPLRDQSDRFVLSSSRTLAREQLRFGSHKLYRELHLAATSILMYHICRESQIEFIHSRFAGQKRADLRSHPEINYPNFTGLMPRIVVLQAIKHQCAFKR